MSETKPKELLDQAIRDMAGAFSARLCAIGVELGIFKDLHQNGRSTSEQIATRMGLNERYLREWLYGIVLSGYVKFDDPVRTQTHRNPVGLRFYRIPGLRNGFFSNRPTKQC